jgi:hypothetical protein
VAAPTGARRPFLPFGQQRVVDGPRAQRGGPGAQGRPIPFEGGPPLDRAELHAPTDVRAEVQISGREAVADQVLAPGQRAFERVQHRGQAPVPRHALAPFRHDEAERLVGRRRFQRAGAKEQPTVVRAAEAVAGRRRQVRSRERVGEVGADRGGFRHHRVAVPDRRDLPHR